MIARRAGQVLTIALAAVVLLLRTDASAQCAMCRTLLKTPEGQQMVAALRSGIVLLLAAPFSIFAVVATLAVRSQRRRHESSETRAGTPTTTE